MTKTKLERSWKQAGNKLETKPGFNTLWPATTTTTATTATAFRLHLHLPPSNTASLPPFSRTGRQEPAEFLLPALARL